MTWEEFQKEFQGRGVGKSSKKKSAIKGGKLETLTPCPTETRRSIKKRISPSRVGHVDLTFLILLYDSPPTSPRNNNLSVLARVAAHTVLNKDYVEKEDNTPLSVLFGKMKRRRMMLRARKYMKKGQMNDGVWDTEALDNF